MRAADLLKRIRQLKTEMEGKSAELSRLKNEYLDTCNAEINKALGPSGTSKEDRQKVATTGWSTDSSSSESSSKQKEAKRKSPYDRRIRGRSSSMDRPGTSDRNGKMRPFDRKNFGRSASSDRPGNRGYQNNQIGMILLKVIKSSNEHLTTRVKFSKFYDRELQNDIFGSCPKGYDHDLVLMARNIKLTSLDFFLNIDRPNVRDQSWNELMVLYFPTDYLMNSYFVRVSGQLVALSEQNDTDYETALVKLHKIEAFFGVGNKHCFTHEIKKGQPDQFSLIRVFTDRQRAFRGRLIQDESYQFVVDPDGWFGQTIKMSGSESLHFLCSCERLHLYDREKSRPNSNNDKKSKKVQRNQTEPWFNRGKNRKKDLGYKNRERNNENNWGHQNQSNWNTGFDGPPGGGWGVPSPAPSGWGAPQPWGTPAQTWGTPAQTWGQQQGWGGSNLVPQGGPMHMVPQAGQPNSYTLPEGPISNMMPQAPASTMYQPPAVTSTPQVTGPSSMLSVSSQSTLPPSASLNATLPMTSLPPSIPHVTLYQKSIDAKTPTLTPATAKAVKDDNVVTQVTTTETKVSSINTDISVTDQSTSCPITVTSVTQAKVDTKEVLSTHTETTMSITKPKMTTEQKPDDDHFETEETIEDATERESVLSDELSNERTID